ncbi:MAG TPA: ATP-binding cassette domain-containing protein [Blastocatellia bacterium]|nr:ATP-binding cassette domain-containing protein [Blastocatellia bacterium]
MSIVLENIVKRYGTQLIVDRVSLEVGDGEFFVLLGASGSGKSTILRMIAGLARPNAGRILLHGRDVTPLSPQQRGTGMVFQNYSIFHHMSVAENIAFGLKIRKRPKAERQAKTEQLLDMVGLAGLGNRLPSQLSGGQQQRVAVARALAYEPNVLLLDEPFGALDVKIRTQLRRSLKEIQKNLGVATILVTHDQEEAFELADRIGVLERGRLLEVGEGEQLYARPKSSFVATFLGAGTVLVGPATSGKARFNALSLPVPDDIPREEGSRVQLLIRPEHVILSKEEPPEGAAVLGRGTVIEQNFNGAARRATLRLPHMPATRQIAPPIPFGEEGFLLDAIVPADEPLTDKEVWVSLRSWHILGPPVPRLMVFDSLSGSTEPLKLARQIMEKLEATATLLAVADGPEAAETLREKHKRRMDSDLSEAEFRMRYGDAAEQIISEQAETPYEMVILAPVQRRFSIPDARTEGLGALIGKVLQQSRVPVLVAKGEHGSLSKILICTAAGEPGKSDVQVGGRLARRLKASVTLLYVTARSDLPGALARVHLERAAGTLRSLDVEGEIRYRQAETAAAGILAEAAEGAFDLIVVGGHGPGSRKLFKLNDVTRQVVAGSNCPVLVVPPDAS